MPTYDEIQQFIEELLDRGANCTEEELSEYGAEFEDALETLATLEADKIDAIAGAVLSRQAHADFLRDEATRMTAKAKATETSAARMMEWVNTLIARRGTALKGARYTISRRRSERVEVSIDAKLLPESFRREKVEVEPDKAAIKEALKSGMEVNGARLVEIYSVQIR